MQLFLNEISQFREEAHSFYGLVGLQQGYGTIFNIYD